jgi:TetR/AcrR family transcriptional repressor of nem operon
MGRPKEFDPEKALSAATDLFWRNGYGTTTPAELVDTLGIGKGSLYNAFGCKHALFEQALRRYGDERVAKLTAALNDRGPVRARLQAALERIAAPENAHLRRRGCLAVNAVTELGPRDKAVTRMVRSVFERMQKAFQRTLEEGQRSGELRSDRDAKDLATMLLTLSLGTTIMGKALDEAGPLQDAARAIVSLL